jgi:hypothetical protein
VKSVAREIDILLKDERYSLWSLPSRPFTSDVVEHWLRYHYPSLLKTHECGPSGAFEEDLHAIYMDLSIAISHLPDEEKVAIGFLLEGFPLYGRDNVALQLGVNDRVLRKRLKSAYAKIAQELKD